MIMEGGTSIGGRVKDWKKGAVRNWKRLLDVSAEKVIFNQSDTQSSTIPTQKSRQTASACSSREYSFSCVKKNSDEEIDESVKQFGSLGSATFYPM